jgi:hypothetical protein
MTPLDIEFSITPEDAYRYHLAQLGKPGTPRTKYIAMHAFGVLVGAVLAGSLAGCGSIGPLAGLLLFATCIAFFSTLAYLHAHGETRRSLRKHMNPVPNRLRIAPEGLTITRPEGEERLNWELVKGVADLEPEGFIRIEFTEARWPILIPKRCIGDPASALQVLETARRLPCAPPSPPASPPESEDHLRVDNAPSVDDLYRYHLACLRAPGSTVWQLHLIGPIIGGVFVFAAVTNHVRYSAWTFLLVVTVTSLLVSAFVFYVTHGAVRRRMQNDGAPEPETLVLRKEGLLVITSSGEHLIRWSVVHDIRMDPDDGPLVFEAGRHTRLVPRRGFRTPQLARDFHAAAVRFKAEASPA